MNKKQYKKKSKIHRIRKKNPELSVNSANAVIKLMECLGPLPQEKRRRLLKAACILVGFDE